MDGAFLRAQSKQGRIMQLFFGCAHLMQHRINKNHEKGKILVILKTKGKITQRELLNFTNIRSASLSELLSKMEKAGLIMRERDEKDHRNYLISITEKGRQAEKELEMNLDEKAVLHLSCLTDAEQDQLEIILEKLFENWKQFCLEKEREKNETGCCKKPQSFD